MTRPRGRVFAQDGSTAVVFKPLMAESIPQRGHRHQLADGAMPAQRRELSRTPMLVTRTARILIPVTEKPAGRIAPGAGGRRRGRAPSLRYHGNLSPPAPGRCLSRPGW